MKLALKILAGLIGFLVLLGLGGYTYVNLTWKRDYSDIPYPAIVASSDSAILAAGEYLGRTVGHCTACHGTNAQPKPDYTGAVSGGFVFDIPMFGKFVAANLTSDRETGLGARSDGEIARAIRNAVGHDGRFLGFMRFAMGPMSDEDLTAIVSWLRVQPPVHNQVEAEVPGFILKALSGKMLPRTSAPPAHVARGGISVERGRYLAEGPAVCAGCHTPANPMTFEPTGQVMSGSTMPEPDQSEAGFEIVAPNLTPDPTTGLITSWTEDQFVARFAQGRVHNGSPMPWENFKGLDESDLRSLYRYLRSLPPTVHDVGPSRRRVGEGPRKP